MIGREVRRVQPFRRHVSHVGMKVGRLHPEYEAVGVGETQTKSVAVPRQQRFVIDSIHV